MTKHFFIMNPRAGGGRAGACWPKIETLIKSKFTNFEIIKTSHAGQGTSLAAEISKSHDHATIVSCGGDGTNNEIINGLFAEDHLINTNIRFGILPIGSGNDFARTLNLPTDKSRVLDIIAAGKTKAVKIGHVLCKDDQDHDISRYFLNIFSFGLSGFAGRLINGSKKPLGPKVAYLSNTIKAMLLFSPFDVDLFNAKGQLHNASDQLYCGSAMSVVVANGKYFGNGLKIAPQADLDSDNFTVVVITGMSTPKVLAKFLKVFSGSHIHDPMIKCLQSAQLSAKTAQSSPVYLDIDGEALGKLPITVTTAKEKLNLIVP